MLFPSEEGHTSSRASLRAEVRRTGAHSGAAHVRGESGSNSPCPRGDAGSRKHVTTLNPHEAESHRPPVREKGKKKKLITGC